MASTRKKVYCPSCKRLVKSRKENTNETTSILCNSCGKSLYSWDGVAWKYLGDES